MDRHFTKTSLNSGLAVKATLYVDGEVVPVGNIASGSATQKILGTTLGQRMWRVLYESFSGNAAEPGRKIQTVTANVFPADKARCATFFSRLKGESYIRKK
jgi:hypothetical protein